MSDRLDVNVNAGVDEVSDKMKRIVIDEEEENPLTTGFTPAEQDVILQLTRIQDEHRKIEQKYEEEWSALKKSYEKLYKPLYNKRAEILSQPLHDASEAPTGTCLPGFWLKAFLNSYTLKNMIDEADEPVLEYLMDVTTQWVDDMKQESFRLSFVFAPNPYFKNAVITKQYNLETGKDEEDSMLQSTVSSEIQWLPGKNVTKKKVSRRQRSKRTHESRVIKEFVDNPKSFFTFFSNRDIPSVHNLQMMEQREVEQLAADVEMEYNAGVLIRDRLIPYAVKWYLGEMESEGSEEEYSDADTDSDNDEDSDIEVV